MSESGQQLLQRNIEHQIVIQALNARRRQFDSILAERETRAQQTSQGLPPQDPKIQNLGNIGMYDDLPLTEPSDLTFIHQLPQFIGPRPRDLAAFQQACRGGDLATVRGMLFNPVRAPSPAFLHHGLTLALGGGAVDVARYLMDIGAPVVRQTPVNVLSAPVDRQIPLFELLGEYGWTPNSPGLYGEVLLPFVLTNHMVLKWFLDHGANPNLGKQMHYRYGDSKENSCTALEKAAYSGDLDAVRMLLDAGAVIQNGFPLHAAAGSWPPGGNPHIGIVTPSQEFDKSQIPVMALLVERGADVNQCKPPQSGNLVPGYAIIEAVMAGAVERVRWLLEHGADPTLRGPWGSAVDYSVKQGSEEMRRVVEGALQARMDTD